MAAVIANDSLAQAPTQFAIKILSSPSYAVTGGDALVEVRIPASTPLSDVSIKLNFKCALKPVDPADYNPALNAAQLAMVPAVFPTGVCDFTKPGIGKVPLANTWLSYPVPGTFFHMQ